MKLKLSFLEILCFIVMLLIGLVIGWYLAQILPYSILWRPDPTHTPVPMLQATTMVMGW